MSESDFTLYDDPELIDTISVQLEDGQREVMLRIQGMHCGACVRRLEKALQALTGPQASLRCDVPSGSAELRWQPSAVALSAILQAFSAMGFGADLLPDNKPYHALRQQRRGAVKRIGVALLLGMQIMMLASAEYFGLADPAFSPLLRFAQWAMATPVLLYAGWPFLRDGLRALAQRKPSMDSPVALALMAAYGLSSWNTVSGQGHVYFDSVAMFVLLLSLARFWQNKGQLLAADRLRRLMANQPLSAWRECAEGSERVRVEALQAGDVVTIPPGEALPADGELLADAALDESLISGEALPCDKSCGERGLAGSVNLGTQALRLRVTETGAKTALSQIARLVQRAQWERPRLDTVVEKVASYFVLLVLLLAVAALWFWRADPATAIEAALAVLVVTCPCALSLSVPTSLSAAVTRLARHSILVVRTDSLLTLAKLRHVCVDKTGTLTRRAMRLARCQPTAGDSEAQCRAWAAQLEWHIRHPIAQAFTQAYVESSGTQSITPAAEVELRPGQGVFGQINGQAMALRPITSKAAEDFSADPFHRWFRLFKDGQAVADFALMEDLRPGARAVVQDWLRSRLDVHLLSGDPTRSAAELGQYLGIKKVFSALTPEKKLAYLQVLQADGSRVMAVGDGINDGPLLAGADISVGMASGAALTQAHGDVILLNDDLQALRELFVVGRKVRRIVRQNLAWALSYNLTMVPLAFAGWMTPWMAALGMGASSLLVTLNALRVLRQPAPGGSQSWQESLA